ncbi:predicted protein [Postia placenta Mad-698-R]|uniref:Uncharacterized protein n=1 Tax=Postia placenta MAD-698-R-SB12 TaxID=670580 RepID=A0A1X6N2K8_9APHY|nr:hypothetical protein POSPLADRAFT_1046248 [Postia placenta MAD-698-R-SB12]EED78545.1 predicted protein [Postia placenta Mad-698-R]OSX62857.1 hypothetical protein POSPLADRAFT_1046248 [Postia placenta MAD-698-R-SB12]
MPSKPKPPPPDLGQNRLSRLRISLTCGLNPGGKTLSFYAVGGTFALIRCCHLRFASFFLRGCRSPRTRSATAPDVHWCRIGPPRMASYSGLYSEYVILGRNGIFVAGLEEGTRCLIFPNMSFLIGSDATVAAMATSTIAQERTPMNQGRQDVWQYHTRSPHRPTNVHNIIVIASSTSNINPLTGPEFAFCDVAEMPDVDVFPTSRKVAAPITRLLAEYYSWLQNALISSSMPRGSKALCSATNMCFTNETGKRRPRGANSGSMLSWCDVFFQASSDLPLAQIEMPAAAVAMIRINLNHCCVVGRFREPIPKDTSTRSSGPL